MQGNLATDYMYAKLMGLRRLTYITLADDRSWTAK